MLPEKNAYTIIPGKNWKLSLAEIITFLKARRVNFNITDLSKSFFTITSEGTIDPNIVDSLGGTIKLGRILSQIPTETVEHAFLHKNEQALKDTKNCLLSETVFNNLFQNPLNKQLFGASVYVENPRLIRPSKRIQRSVGSCLKDELAARGTKARFMGFPKSRRLPQLTHVETLKKNLAGNGTEILFCIGKTESYISKTLSVHNPFEFQKRDINRPIQRKICSIPPRLAKTMVNLSKCLPEKILLDPFCGVGTILQEALLAGAQVTGIDIDPWCVKASLTNLSWLTNEYGLKDAKFKVSTGDSRHLTERVGRETVDCIVTEPDLGPPLRHLPTEAYAGRIISGLKPLYASFLKGAYEALRPGGNLVFVTPYVKTRSGNFVTLNLEEEVNTIGFRLTHPFENGALTDRSSLVEGLATASSFVDIAKRHKIGRKINILQKQ